MKKTEQELIDTIGSHEIKFGNVLGLIRVEEEIEFPFSLLRNRLAKKYAIVLCPMECEHDGPNLYFRTGNGASKPVAIATAAEYGKDEESATVFVTHLNGACGEAKIDMAFISGALEIVAKSKVKPTVKVLDCRDFAKTLKEIEGDGGAREILAPFHTKSALGYW